jgi:hypothetical protein
MSEMGPVISCSIVIRLLRNLQNGPSPSATGQWSGDETGGFGAGALWAVDRRKTRAGHGLGVVEMRTSLPGGMFRCSCLIFLHKINLLEREEKHPMLT